LAGTGAGDVFDLLQARQLELARGEDGAGKQLSCCNATLRRIAERKPGSVAELARVQGVGEQKAERFGPAFLEILATA
jgi:ATP-dependent DNA helicase RecQ